ncbi:MAG TPA: hypothetical protein DDX29_00115 [Clostridiales bacterium]|nr:hypothetical protein [Clostridiales bacterium]
MGYEALPIITGRNEMYKELEKAICNISQSDDEDNDELYFDDLQRSSKKYLKALPIESNAPLEKIQLDNNIEFLPTKEKTLKILKLTRNKVTSYSYLDMLDQRFWILYSLDNSVDIKKDIKNLIQKNNSQLDYTWFSSSSLKHLSSGYSKTRFSIKFNNRFHNANIPMKRLSLQLTAEDASDIANNLLDNPFIGKGACFSNIEVLLSDKNNDYVKSRLSMDGSINISRGNSISNFIEFQQKTIQGHYRPIIERIENDYSIEYDVNIDGINIKGDILSIKLSTKIENIEFFVHNLLKGTNPFRFLGFSNIIDDEHILVDVLDLHNFGHFDLEIFPDELLINLPKGSCGNSIVRLFTLCQENIDPKAKLIGGSGDAIIPA